MAALLFINDIQVPSMSRELMIELQTLVSAGKNANGELCGSKVGRDQYKLNDLEWPRLTAHESFVRNVKSLFLMLDFRVW